MKVIYLGKQNKIGLPVLEIVIIVQIKNDNF
jgi:hypothetical protein